MKGVIESASGKRNETSKLCHVQSRL